VEVEGKKGDTTLTGADELYHDEAFRATINLLHFALFTSELLITSTFA